MKKMNAGTQKKNRVRTTWLSRSHDEMLKALDIETIKKRNSIKQGFDNLLKQAEDLLDRRGKGVIQDLECDDMISQKGFERAHFTTYNEGTKLEDNDGDFHGYSLSMHDVEPMEMPVHTLCELTKNPGSSVCSFPLNKLSEGQKRRMYCVRVLRQNEMIDSKQSESESESEVINSENERVNSILFHRDKSEANEQDANTNNSRDCSSAMPPRDLLYPVYAIRTNAQRRLQINLLEQVIRDEMVIFNIDFREMMEEHKSFKIFLRSTLSKIMKISREFKIIDPEEHLTASRYGLAFPPDTISEFHGDSTEKDSVWQDDEKCKYYEDLFSEHMDEVKRLVSAADDLSEVFNKKLTKLREKRTSVQQRILFNELNMYLIMESISMNSDGIREEIFVQEEVKQAQEAYERARHDLEIAQTEYKNYETIHQRCTKEIKLMDKGFRRKLSEDPLDQETFNLLFQMYQQTFDPAHGNQEGQLMTKNSSMYQTKANRRSTLGRQSGKESVSSNKSKSSVAQGKTLEYRKDNNFGTSVLGTIELARHQAYQDYFEKDFRSENDPFYDVPEEDTFSAANSIRHDMIPTVDDVPDGFDIDKEIWRAMLSLREERITKVLDLEKCTVHLNKMKIIRDVQQGEVKACYEALSTLRDRRRQIVSERLDRLKYIDFLVPIKQGQDEIETGAITTDYSDAVYLPTCAIEGVNNIIVSLGQERLEILYRIKKFRGILNKMLWRRDILTLQNNDARETLKDYHLLRLTSEVKKILNGEVEEDHGVVASRLEAKLSRQNILHESKVDKLIRQKEKIMKSIKKIEKENKTIQNKLEDLKEDISKIEKEGEADSTCNEAADKKMKDIMKRSKIMKRIKSQSNELKTLRSELDVLRQKTFPSFPSA